MKNKNIQKIELLCTKDENGDVIKSQITIRNYEVLKDLMKTLDFELLKTKKDFSYRQYCKIFDTFQFKNKKCNGKICCQAITENETQCTRSASNFTSIDITGMNLLPKLPEVIKNNMGIKDVEKLKLLGFANSCCFYCYQHAAMFIAEKITWSHNLPYYFTHFEDLASIFFDNVKPKKISGVLTYNFHTIGDIRTVDEIIKRLFLTHTISMGVVTGIKNTINYDFYWIGIKFIVFFYDKIKPYIVKYFKEDKNKAADLILLRSAKILLTPLAPSSPKINKNIKV